MIEVLLSSEEVMLAACHGVWRHIDGARRATNGTPARQERIAISWNDEIEGACAEVAVARMSKRYWTGMQFARGAAGADVGDDVDARWTQNNGGRLLVKEWDDPSHLYVLVLGNAPLMRIVGYMRGVDAKVEHYWDATLPRPCFAVPQSDLTPINARQETLL